jgi:hypothetical protein
MPMPDTTKHDVLEALVARLRAELDAAVSAAHVARDEATGEESKAENQYDTRAIEAGYLAGAQSKRVEAARVGLGRYEMALANPRGAVRTRLVRAAADDGTVATFLLGPSAAGYTLQVNETTVRVVTPASPVGAQLASVEPDDEVVLAADRTGSGQRLTVISVE